MCSAASSTSITRSQHDEHDFRAPQGSLSAALALDDYNAGPFGYLALVEKAKATLQMPVIASLNGVSPGTWVEHAILLEEAGADALELNIY